MKKKRQQNAKRSAQAVNLSWLDFRKSAAFILQALKMHCFRIRHETGLICNSSQEENNNFLKLVDVKKSRQQLLTEFFHAATKGEFDGKKYKF